MRDSVGSCWFIAMTNKKDVALALPPFISNFLKRQTENWVYWTAKKTAGRRSSLDVSPDHFRTVIAACFKGITLDLLSWDFLADKPAAAEDRGKFLVLQLSSSSEFFFF